VIGDRSFGDDADSWAGWGGHDPGLQENGVAACAKHFPGHGDTDLDSHLDLPAVDHPRSRLDEVELRPFKKAIEAGVATVMTRTSSCARSTTPGPRPSRRGSSPACCGRSWALPAPS